MNNFEFGITMTVIGMGTTFVTLIFLGFVIDIMKRLFPVEAAAPQDQPAALKEATEQS